MKRLGTLNRSVRIQLQIKRFFFRKILMASLLCVLSLYVVGQEGKGRGGKEPEKKKAIAVNINIREELKVFKDLNGHAEYFLSLCADVPNNARPMQVARKQETGHVFVVLARVDPATSDTVHKVFGYYPRKGLPTLFVKRVKSVIKDNSRREYDLMITKKITAAEFDTVISLAISLADQKYHLNHFNCYDYGIQLFNAVAGPEKLPVTRVRFPFVFGKGGSPCCIYRDLKKLCADGSALSSLVEFGSLVAPASTGRQIPLVHSTN